MGNLFLSKTRDTTFLIPTYFSSTKFFLFGGGWYILVSFRRECHIKSSLHCTICWELWTLPDPWAPEKQGWLSAMWLFLRRHEQTALTLDRALMEDQRNGPTQIDSMSLLGSPTGAWMSPRQLCHTQRPPPVWWQITTIDFRVSAQLAGGSEKAPSTQQLLTDYEILERGWLEK